MLSRLFKFSHRLERKLCPAEPAGLVSYSQCGEDMLVNYLFNLRNVPQPSYLDLGAHDPYYLSNTGFFYRKGCRGINVEANPELIGDFQRWRPEDANLNVGIGSAEGEADFYVMENKLLSTFSRAECDTLQGFGHKLKRVESIKLTTLVKILATHREGIFPDFLSLDVEGLDLAILATIDFERTWPKIICVEAAEYSPQGTGKRRSELIDFLISKGYHEYANTNLNAIMVRNQFWFT